MKVEPSELLNIVAEASTEIVNEHGEFSEQALIVMRLMLEKIKNKLFELEISDMGLTPEEINNILNKTGD